MSQLASPQINRSGIPGPPPPTTPTLVSQPNQGPRQPRPDAPPPGEWDVQAVTQTAEGPVYQLRGKAKLESTEMLFRADEIDYNEETGYLEARGHVFFQNFDRNEELRADKVEYELQEKRGRFYKVSGSGYPHIDARPGVLTTNNPFYFQGEWAERLADKYILHNGFVTDCKIPNPWWTLRGPKFDIIPGERAIAYRTVFRLKRIPLFYSPFFYKSLEKVPRRSGFLTPNLGNSSRRGKMVGIGYYWAINRSYDATYRFQDFTTRGIAHHVEFRGKPRDGSDFDAVFYGVQDRGLPLEDGTRRKEGGFSFSMGGRYDLGHGFYARGSVNYLSSLVFRQAFTESFNEAIFSESHSVGSIVRNWSSYSLNTVFARLENFQSTEPGHSIVIRKLPQFEFNSRDHRIWKNVPLWISWESSAGLLRRTQLEFQTRQFMERADVRPRIVSALRWKDFHLIPGFSVRETHYGERVEDGRITGNNINRTARELTLDLIAPAFQRTFNRKTWLGDKLKHVIEPRSSFRHVSGIHDFSRYILLDETDLLSNTTEAEVSVINRLYVKRRGQVFELVTWELAQRRYFDADFGGAVVEGRRNVVLSSVDLTPFAFLNRPRDYSPVVSILRARPKPGIAIEWRADYDPLLGGIVNSGFTADIRLGKYFLAAGNNHTRAVALNPGDTELFGGRCSQAVALGTPLLSPCANQFRGLIGFGNPAHRGWNAGFSAVYDVRIGAMQFATTQVAYNTDCCGFSVQYRRFNFGSRNENQFRVAFAVSNIGSFGTLKKQERLF